MLSVFACTVLNTFVIKYFLQILSLFSAMRNRGIEIYMERLSSVVDGPADYDDFSKFSTELDLMGLLQHTGFTSSAHSQALIHIHSKLALNSYGKIYEDFFIEP